MLFFMSRSADGWSFPQSRHSLVAICQNQLLHCCHSNEVPHFLWPGNHWADKLAIQLSHRKIDFRIEPPFLNTKRLTQKRAKELMMFVFTIATGDVTFSFVVMRLNW